MSLTYLITDPTILSVIGFWILLFSMIDHWDRVREVLIRTYRFLMDRTFDLLRHVLKPLVRAGILAVISVEAAKRSVILQQTGQFEERAIQLMNWLVFNPLMKIGFLNDHQIDSYKQLMLFTYPVQNKGLVIEYFLLLVAFISLALFSYHLRKETIALFDPLLRKLSRKARQTYGRWEKEARQEIKAFEKWEATQKKQVEREMSWAEQSWNNQKKRKDASIQSH